jgi:hypothetical protein
METQPQNFDRDQEQKMLAEILENSRKTKQYMKWQLIITVALVVVPLLASIIIVPLVLSSLTSTYTEILQ